MTFEMHLHTAECDRAAKSSGEEIARIYHEAGYDGIVVTDHYFSLFSEWFADELSGCDHRGYVDRWLRGYRSVKAAAEKYGMTVLPGAEVRFDGTINDYLLYGVEEEFFYRAPQLNRLHSVEELLSVLPEDALLVQAHPFRDKMTVADPSPLFGIETHNGKNDSFRNHLADLFADHYQKAKFSGSDFHAPAHAAKAGMIFDSPIRTPHELSLALRRGEYTLIKN